MKNPNLANLGVLALFGAAMAIGYYWNFTAIAPKRTTSTTALQAPLTVHGHVRFPMEPQWRLELRQEMALIKSRSVLNSALNKGGIGDFAIVKKQRDPIEWLERALVVQFPDDGNVMRISLTGPDSHELTEIVNAVLDAYDEGLVAKEKSESDREADRLDAAHRHDALIESLEIERAHRDFQRGLIPRARTADLKSGNRVKVETFRRRDVSIQRAKPE